MREALLKKKWMKMVKLLTMKNTSHGVKSILVSFMWLATRTRPDISATLGILGISDGHSTKICQWMSKTTVEVHCWDKRS